MIAHKRLTPKPFTILYQLKPEKLTSMKGHTTFHIRIERNQEKLSNLNYPKKSSKKKWKSVKWQKSIKEICKSTYLCS